MLELRAAKEWKMSPREWRAQTFDDRALMLAFEMFSNTREAYRMEWMEERREAEKKHGPKGMNPYQAMKANMGL